MNPQEHWHLIVDVAECHNCHNCVIASKDELVGNDFPGYSAPHPAQGSGVLRIERRARGRGHHVDVAYLPRLCNHCADAPCVKAGRGAVKQRADGIVVFDPQACHGRRDLVDACPYGAVVWNEERVLPQTWFFDAHLLDAGWREPRCVTVCPTRALQAVKANDDAIAERAQREGLEPLRPELGTRPRVLYRHLARHACGFVAASITLRGECAEGAAVTLHGNDGFAARAVADAFGDVRFGGLQPGSYRLHASLGASHAEREVTLAGDEGAVLDEIELMP
jgi:Fe-S-cluster-containing dehydrogenase component